MDKKKYKRLVKFLTYVLCHRPDEFGIFLDEDGSITIKELLRAVKEEEGWGFVRESHLKDLNMLGFKPPFSVEGKRIKLVEEVPKPYYPTESPPKILFCGVRSKALHHIYNFGLNPIPRKYIPLCISKELALRIGKRREKNPVLLKIKAQEAESEGILFRSHGEMMFLSEELPLKFISGPPLPQKEEKKPKETKVKKAPTPELEKHAGSFFLDLAKDPDQLRRYKLKKKKEASRGPKWKREARKMRKKKEKF